eukprot:scaffold73518_cov50-Cyclotella_meneghiniana.AAC.1
MTAATPFQYLFMGIMNGGRRFRLDFIIHNGQHQLVFQSGKDDNFVLNSPLLMTAAAPFQYLFMGIMNGGRGLRLEFIIHNGQHQLMTAAAPFQYLFMGIMNGVRGLKLEFIIHNGQHQL